MPDEADAEILQVVCVQLWQHCGVDRVVAKRLFVLLHAKAVEPGCDIHACLPRHGHHRASYLTRIARCARGISAAGRRPPYAVHRATRAAESPLLSTNAAPSPQRVPTLTRLSRILVTSPCVE